MFGRLTLRQAFTSVLIRFQGAILLAALTAIAATRLERAALDQRRGLGQQHYQVDALRERVARLRLNVERLGSLSSLARPFEEGYLESQSKSGSRGSTFPTTPLLRWRAAGVRE